VSGTDDAINQGIVLAGVLTGFAFVIAAELALREVRVKQSERLAYGFFLVGLSCLTAVAVGILYFANEPGTNDQRLLSIVFFILLTLGALIFLYTMAELIRLNIQEREERFALLLAIVGSVLLILILGVITRN
jgi:predicted membrane channel-forming protein YqfA (hemolysin III family)